MIDKQQPQNRESLPEKGSVWSNFLDPNKLYVVDDISDTQDRVAIIYRPLGVRTALFFEDAERWAEEVTDLEGNVVRRFNPVETNQDLKD